MMKFSSKDYLRIDIANNAGLDKKDWNTRLVWFAYNEHKLESISNDVMYQKAVHAYRQVQKGYPTGHIMFFDSTTSFLGIMSLMSGDPVGASQSNIIGNVRNDFYTNVTNRMNNIIQAPIALARDVIKYIIMPTFYNSKLAPALEWGKGSPEFNAYYQTLYELAPGAMEVMKDINKCWDSEALEYKWTLPDGHTAVVKVEETVETKIEVSEINTQYRFRYKANKPQKKGISLPANIIQSVDAYIVREMVRMAYSQGIPLLTIHDAFGTSPKYMNQVRQNYIDILVKMSKMDLLGSILSQITGTTIEYIKYTDDLHKHIINSEYAIC